MKKKDRMRTVRAVGILALAVLMMGCSSENTGNDESASEGDMNLTGYTETGSTVTEWEIGDLEGHWVDVNGDTTLDFKGSEMTVQDSWGKESYQVRITEGTPQYIQNTAENDTGFFIMSSLTIGSDGALTAYEMVLDAEGHLFRFVREGDLAGETEIQDKSEALPKTVESKELVSFDLNFSLENTRYDVPMVGGWESGQYSIEITQEDGVYQMEFRAMGESYVIRQYSGEVSEEYVQGLADLIEEQKVAENNGYYLTNNENYHSWSFYADYASGEKLRLQAYGRAALECPFSINAFLEYTALALEAEES